MRAFCSVFACAKAGNSWSEYEDAAAPALTREFDTTRLRVAVADGATEGMLSGTWANCLTEEWAASGRHQFSQVITRAQARFAERSQAYASERSESGRPLAWFEAAKLDDGAFATFVGLTITDDGVWHCVAVGDSCLFHLRRQRLICSFPIRRAGEFGRSPALARSIPSRAATELLSGRWEIDDTFLLCSDAIAHWLLTQEELGSSDHWAEMLDMDVDDPTSFEERVDTLRSTTQLKNDDVTVLRLDLYG